MQQNDSTPSGAMSVAIVNVVVNKNKKNCKPKARQSRLGVRKVVDQKQKELRTKNKKSCKPRIIGVKLRPRRVKD